MVTVFESLAEKTQKKKKAHTQVILAAVACTAVQRNYHLYFLSLKITCCKAYTTSQKTSIL